MGMDVNGIDFIGKMFIYYVFLFKDISVVVFGEFFKVGIKVNVKDVNGWNEVYVVVEVVDVSYCWFDLDCWVVVIKLLVEVGVDVSEGDMYGIIFLYFVIMKSDFEIFVMLFDVGVDIMKRFNFGVIVFYWSCRMYNMVYVMIYLYFNEG